MDPALWEVFERSTAEEVEAVVRLDGPPPPGLRLVARFGPVATCRMRREDIVAIRNHHSVFSLKANRRLTLEDVAAEAPSENGSQALRPGPTGRGVVVAVVDWGCDFAHSAFRDAAGHTRLLALWDQRGPSRDDSPAPYGYGRLISRREIEAALAQPSPYEALGYHPGESDAAGTGTHGTHVLDIAAGSQRGVAPGADLVFVHLGERGEAEDGIASSVTLLEAIDFIDGVAGDRPCVVNLSLGRHGGPHDATTLTELAIEQFITRRSGRLVVQSAGNYFAAQTHAHGNFLASPAHVAFDVPFDDRTPNELDIWYRREDSVRCQAWSPTGDLVVDLLPGQRGRITLDGDELGRAYHRLADPNNGEHNIHLFLDADPRTEGRWRVRLTALHAFRGDFDAYLERDKAPPGQARFIAGDASVDSTTGTICHAPSALTVGAYDGHLDGRPASEFTSAGPTRQGRQKPDLCAPGVRVTAARSTPLSEPRPIDATTEKSGSSMAAPQAAGTVALLFELAPTLTAAAVREVVMSTVDPIGDADVRRRLGAGYLNTVAAVAALRTRMSPPPQRETEDVPMSEERDEAWEPLVEDTAERMPYLEDFDVPPPPAVAPSLPGADRLFSAARRAGSLPGLRLLGAPGQRATPRAEPGDLVVVGAPGEGRFARSFQVREVLDAGRAVVAPSLGGAPVVRQLFDGGRVPFDTALFRGEAELGESGPAFAVGHVQHSNPGVRMPITFEDIERSGTGVVIRRLRCDTMVELTAANRSLPLGASPALARFIQADDMVRSLSPGPALWREDGAGRLEAKLDTVIYYPARASGSPDLAPGGAFPLVVICMGNHQAFATMSVAAEHSLGMISGQEWRQVERLTFGTEVTSHLGYSASSRTRPPDMPAGAPIDYLQEELARQGVVSVSVSTNGANLLGLMVETRADYVLAAIAEMRALNRDRSSPFFRRIDFDRVALVGHSRGGDGVLRATHKSRSTRVKALVHLASTDITGVANGTSPAAPPGPLPAAAEWHRTSFVTAPMRVTADLDVMYLSIYGSRDGDVSGERDQRNASFGNPFRHYDRSSAQRCFQFWHGATHNRFNRFWEDDDEEPGINRAAGGLLNRLDQERRATEAVTGWLRFVLKRDAAEAHRFDGRTPTAIAASLPVIAMWKFGAALKTIDRFDDDARADRNTLGGRNVPPGSGLVDEVRMANDNPPGAGETAFQFMHIDPVLRANLPPRDRSADPPVTSGAWRAEIPAADRDFGRFALLTLRVTRHFDESEVTGATTAAARAALVPTVTLTLHDQSRVRASAPASSPRGTPSLPDVRHVGSLDLTKYHFETWQVPLSAFTGVDLHHVTALEVEIGGQSGHAVYVDTLSLVRPVS